MPWQGFNTSKHQHTSKKLASTKHSRSRFIFNEAVSAASSQKCDDRSRSESPKTTHHLGHTCSVDERLISQEHLTTPVKFPRGPGSIKGSSQQPYDKNRSPTPSEQMSPLRGSNEFSLRKDNLVPSPEQKYNQIRGFSNHSRGQGVNFSNPTSSPSKQITFSNKKLRKPVQIGKSMDITRNPL